MCIIILEKYEQIIDGRRPAHAVTTQKPGVTFRLVESSFGVAVSDTARGQGYGIESCCESGAAHWRKGKGSTTHTHTHARARKYTTNPFFFPSNALYYIYLYCDVSVAALRSARTINRRRVSIIH